MEKPLSLSLLYTGGIDGDLDMLPRLYTFLDTLKKRAGEPCLLLDMGWACADDVWHCRETGGRSVLLALDGMGYDAANASDLLDPAGREKFAGQVSLGLVAEERDWRFAPAPADGQEIVATLRPRDEKAGLQIVLEPGGVLSVAGNVLRLGPLSKGQVGEARLDLGAEPRLRWSWIHSLPPSTPPNASIAGLVEFVMAEARLLARKR